MKFWQFLRHGGRAMSIAAGFMTIAGGAAADPGPGLGVNAKVEVGRLSYVDNEDDDILSDSGSAATESPHAGTIRDSRSLLRPGIGSANASAYAGYGVLGASANATSLIHPASARQPAGAGGTAYASAEFADVLHVNAPGRAGQWGTLIVPWKLTGTWGGGLTGPFPRGDSQGASAEWHLDIHSSLSESGEPYTVYSETHAFGEFEAYQGAHVTYAKSYHQARLDDWVYGPVVVDSEFDSATVPTLWSQITVRFGTPTTLEATLRVSALAGVTNFDIEPSDPGLLQLRTAQAYGDFSHTFRWGGVQQVLDADGHVITDWTVVSGSGTDYAVANAVSVVPEPATWLSLSLGLLVMALFRARSAHRRLRAHVGASSSLASDAVRASRTASPTAGPRRPRAAAAADAAWASTP